MNASLRKAPKTERCGGCGAAVDTTSRYTVRSRYTGRALCDRCGIADHAEHLAVKPTVTAPRTQRQDSGTRATFDAGFELCVRCGREMLVTMLSARSLRSNSPMCEPCATGSGRDECRRPQPVTPAHAHAYAERALEVWRARPPDVVEEWDAYIRGADQQEIEWRMRRTDAALYGTDADIPWEVRHQADEDDDDDEYRVAFLDAEGRAVYLPEPDGEPVPGRWYESRWWAADSVSEVRDTWVGEAAWGLR